MSLSETTKTIQSFIGEHPQVNKIDKKELSDFYVQLIDCLVDHNHQYYIENNPLISDKEYDELFEYLKKIEEAHPEIITSNSPTQGLSWQVSEWFQQAKHSTKLMSLENTYNAEDLTDREERARKLLEKNKEIRNMEKNNLVQGIGIILQTTKGEYIFQKRDKNIQVNPWKIALFGWGIENNETHEDTAIREFREELEGKIKKEDLIEIGNFESHINKDKYLKIFYVWNIDTTQLKIHEWESIETMSLEEAEKDKNVTDFTKEIIRYFKSMQKISYTIEPKFDGLSVELVYEKWILKQAITRGDGRVGDDITINAKMIKNIPQKLKETVDISVRGEIVMPKSVWKELNKEREEEGETPFANTRNAAAWSIKLLDSWGVAKRGLLCYVYDILKTPKLWTLDSELWTLWMPTFKRIQEANTIDEVINICVDEKIKKELDDQDIEFDGLVIKVKDKQQRKFIWSTDHHPRRAVAYKFPAQLAATQITSVDFQVGRTWIITPVANVNPVQLSWAKLQRVSLHNFDFTKDKDIHLHDWIWLQRSGEVIPYIVSVITDRRTGEEKVIHPPKVCPSCKETVTQRDMHYYCTNEHCPEIMKQRIQHFVSKNCMDIMWIGESIVDLLVENKIIQNIADIYKLSDKNIQIQLLKFPWFGDKKVAEIAKGVEESKHKAFRRLLNGLWIPHVGKKMAQDITSQLDVILSRNEGYNDAHFIQSDIINRLTNEEFLRSIYWIGEKTVKSITEFFNNKHNLKLLEQLEKVGVNIDPSKYNDLIKTSEAKWTFSITGSFDLPREKIAELFQQQGYLFHESPTKSTDFMLIGDKAGSKKEKAQELGLQIYEWRETIVKHFPFLKNISNETNKPKTQSLF